MSAAAGIQEQQEDADNAMEVEAELPDYGGEEQGSPQLDEQGASASSCCAQPGAKREQDEF